MKFKPYQHIKRFQTDEVSGIELGVCYVFPKIDGTNASVWLDEGKVCAGSRKRQVSISSDNAGFYNYVSKEEKFEHFFRKFPHVRLFGEWLVPHTLKTYREDAWRKFYIFDVIVDDEDVYEYLPYEAYKIYLDEFELDYIPPLAIIDSASEEQLMIQLENNTYLIEDGKGSGEGIVIKNYGYKNKYGRVTWAKIVKTEFKDKHRKDMGPPELKGKDMVEKKITDKYVTEALIEKTIAKIQNESGWSSKMIPRLLSTIYHDLITEESWNFVKEYKNPIINYKLLNNLVIHKIKSTKPSLF